MIKIQLAAGPVPDFDIKYRLGLPVTDPAHLRIDPFVPTQVKWVHPNGDPCGPDHPGGRRVVGYGLSGMGYDVRLGHTFRFGRGPLTGELSAGGAAVDPIETPDAGIGPPTRVDTPFVVQPGDCLLGESVEVFRVPEDVIAVVVGKSTWARCFIDLNTTPLEPGWVGTITLEVKNNNTRAVWLRPGEGIGQVVFFAAGGGRCEVPYSRQPGASYMNQYGPTGARHAGPPAGPSPLSDAARTLATAEAIEAAQREAFRNGIPDHPRK